MHKNIINLDEIKKKIHLKNSNAKIIAVSKTFSLEKILPLVEHDHLDFGENKVQEAIEKWTEIKKIKKKINLHMVGKLQTNKVKFAVKIFDYIHSLDSLKLAKKISDEQRKIKKDIKLFIQLNIGNENQKSGIKIEELDEFYKFCIKDLSLNIIGLMCLPPIESDSSIYFQKMEKLSKNLNLKELSMGMSSDYLTAIEYKSTYVRIGTKIFGERS